MLFRSDRRGGLRSGHAAADAHLGVLAEGALDARGGPQPEEQAGGQDHPVDGVEDHGGVGARGIAEPLL